MTADTAPAQWDDEEWRPVAGYEGLYEVSSLGRVRTIGGGKARTHGRILRATSGTTGYLRVALSAANVQRTRKVHRLVAEAFHGPIPLGAYVLHRDGNPANNMASNLYFGDARQNLQDAIAHGVWKPLRGEAVSTAKLGPEAVAAIRASDESITLLARRYGVDPKTIRDARTGRSWSHV